MAAIYDTLSEQKLNGERFDEIQPDFIRLQALTHRFHIDQVNLLLLLIVVPATDTPMPTIWD